MKGMPLPSELEGKGVFGISGISTPDLLFSALNWNTKNTPTKQACFLGFEPTSVLDSTRSPSPPTSSSTSLGGGAGSIGMISVAAAAESRREDWGSELQPLPSAVDLGGASEKCGIGMENWVNILSETAAAGQDQSIFRWIMGDVEDTSNMGISRLLQTSPAGGAGGALDFDYSAGFGAVDQELGLEAVASVSAGNMVGTSVSPDLTFLSISKVPNTPNPIFSPLLSHNLDEKPPVWNPHLLLNPHQNQIQSLQNHPFFSPQHEQQQHVLLSPPPPPLKRQNSGSGANAPFCMLPKQQPMLDSGQELFLRRQREQEIHGFSPHQLLQHRKMSSGGGDEEMMGHQQHLLQETVIDQLYQAAEMVETGNLVLAQGILARLNHQLSPVGKPFLRAAFYFKEALQLLLDMNKNSNTSTYPPHQSPFKHIYRIGAYKSYSEISPILQFANFTCIQALLEALDGFNRIHIVDFNIGYGGQWASLMQELALRNSGTGTSLSLKITIFVSAALYDELELSLIRQNLTHFANEINMSFEMEILSLELLNSSSWSLSLLVSENEAIAVNLPVGLAANYSLSLPVVLQSVKQLCPKIVVSLDGGNDRPDLTFPQYIIYALHSHWTLLDSLDAMNVNLDAQQKIEWFLLHPEIEKTVLGRYQCYEKTPPWRTLFQSSGFSPMTISNFNESQAECLVKRTSVNGFHVEKRQSSLVLFWQQKELISASAWRC